MLLDLVLIYVLDGRKGHGASHTPTNGLEDDVGLSGGIIGERKRAGEGASVGGRSLFLRAVAAVVELGVPNDPGVLIERAKVAENGLCRVDCIHKSARPL